MNRLLFLIILGAATFLVVLYVWRPDLLNDFWLWGVGLAGPLLKGAHLLITKIKSMILPPPSPEVSYMKNKTLEVNETN